VVTALQRRRLLARFAGECMHARAVVTRCAVLLGALVVVAALGAPALPAGVQDAAVLPAAALRVVQDHAGSHRRALFEQRRMHLAGGKLAPDPARRQAGLTEAAQR
jgi:hypothetical protein